jgi:hypothetical protein
MPMQHPAEAARQTARTALAALPTAARAFLEALHAEHFPPAPGGPAYRLEDLLSHLIDCDHYGFGDERLALALAVPVEYLRAVREAAGLLVSPGNGA